MPDFEEILVKAQLASKISDIIKSRKLTSPQAAVLLGMTQPKLSSMMSGQFRDISETKMLVCLTRLGCDDEIVVKTASHSRSEGLVALLQHLDRWQTWQVRYPLSLWFSRRKSLSPWIVKMSLSLWKKNTSSDIMSHG